jgi:hypothetical protein
MNYAYETASSCINETVLVRPKYCYHETRHLLV